MVFEKKTICIDFLLLKYKSIYTLLVINLTIVNQIK